MANPGSVVVKDGGGWGVLASGAVAVRNAAGECPGCCGEGCSGPCCKFNINGCTASSVLGAGFGNQVSFVRSGAFTDEYHGSGGLPNGTFTVSSASTFPHSGYDGVTGVACEALCIPTIDVAILPPISGVGQVTTAGDWRFKSRGTSAPFTPGTWIPSGIWTHLAGDPFFIYTFYSPVVGARIRVAWNLRTNAFGQEFGYGQPLVATNASFAALGYGNINAVEAEGTPSVEWNGCVPTFRYNARFFIDYQTPSSTLVRRVTELNRIDSFAHTVTGLFHNG